MAGKKGLTGGKRVERESEKETLIALVLGLLILKKSFSIKTLEAKKLQIQKPNPSRKKFESNKDSDKTDRIDRDQGQIR